MWFEVQACCPQWRVIWHWVNKKQGFASEWEKKWSKYGFIWFRLCQTSEKIFSFVWRNSALGCTWRSCNFCLSWTKFPKKIRILFHILLEKVYIVQPSLTWLWLPSKWIRKTMEFLHTTLVFKCLLPEGDQMHPFCKMHFCCIQNWLHARMAF